ncbi:Proteasome subunit alpha type-2 [Cucumispora dikerogammari]|nr:Proteasome subunit alpha type-2 [Cucumispora dikerogammari]
MKLNTEASTFFSSSGELTQTKYAEMSTKEAAPSIGLQLNDTIILASIFNNPFPKLINSEKKTYILHKNLAITFSGMGPDFKHLLHKSISLVLEYNEIYGSDISVEMFTIKISNLIQVHTQLNGKRPFGFILLIAGAYVVNNITKFKLYKIDPSGSFINSKNFNINCKANYLKDGEFSKDDGLMFVVKALKENVNFQAEDLSLVYFSDGGFGVLSLNNIIELMGEND